MCGGRAGHSVAGMHITRLLPIVPLAAAGALALWPGAGQAASRTQTLRLFDKPVALKLTHPDGTTVTREPFPEPQPGDVLDVDSVDFRGNHAHHARHWTISNHTRCVFGAGGGEPSCETQVAIGGSLLIFSGEPPKVIDGTGIYQGATGRVVAMKELPHNASDIVARIHLR